MEDLKVTLIQSDLYWRDIDSNLASFEEKIWQIGESTDLIVLPEMFTTGFTMEPNELAEPVNGRTYRWLKQMAAETQAIVMGSVIIRDGVDYYNRLIAMSPNGNSQTYDKKHLFTLAGEDNSFSSGESKIILDIKGWKVMPLICYDLRFPAWSRSRPNQNDLYEYDLLAYVANWPVPRVHAWDTLLKARAIENSAYCLGVNRVGKDGYGKEYSGHSCINDYMGAAVATLGDQENLVTTLISASGLSNYRERFPFQKDGDTFSLD